VRAPPTGQIGRLDILWGLLQDTLHLEPGPGQILRAVGGPGTLECACTTGTAGVCAPPAELRLVILLPSGGLSA